MGKAPDFRVTNPLRPRFCWQHARKLFHDSLCFFFIHEFMTSQRWISRTSRRTCSTMHGTRSFWWSLTCSRNSSSCALS
jgi:hypothetical protein